MLLVPASPLADEPPAPPTAVLDAPSTSVTAGQAVELDSSRSTPGSGAIVGHVWDLDGNGSFETDTGAQPTAEATPKSAGPLTVQVRVVDDHGQSGDAKLDLSVAPPPEAGQSANVTGPGINLAAPATQARTSPTVELVPPKTLRHASATKKHTKAHTTATVTAAASSGVIIKNFKYSPSTSSVHVGDTITWTNQDIAPHTATAKDGSFNTGTINKGKSGSHTFTTAGTFPYICSIHPSMKASVTVLGSSSGSGNGNGSGGTSSGSNSSGSTTPSSSSSSSSLPHTGLDIGVIVLIAMCMTGSGASLRRALR
jgi:plastocyanin